MLIISSIFINLHVLLTINSFYLLRPFPIWAHAKMTVITVINVESSITEVFTSQQQSTVWDGLILLVANVPLFWWPWNWKKEIKINPLVITITKFWNLIGSWNALVFVVMERVSNNKLSNNKLSINNLSDNKLSNNKVSSNKVCVIIAHTWAPICFLITIEICLTFLEMWAL